MDNANKLCNKVGGFLNCEKCPIYSVCIKKYDSTEEFEKAMEEAATDYFENEAKEIESKGE